MPTVQCSNYESGYCLKFFNPLSDDSPSLLRCNLPSHHQQYCKRYSPSKKEEPSFLSQHLDNIRSSMNGDYESLEAIKGFINGIIVLRQESIIAVQR